jgi:hypothetical protein
MEEGKYYQSDKGTPQGGNLSPLLANIYLHYALDLWFEKKVKGALKGYSELIRYADDFIVCFQSEREAQEFGTKLHERLAKFGLKISETKSKIIEFGRYARNKHPETFDFLGITHYCDKTLKGKFNLGRKTSKKKLVQKYKAMNDWLKQSRHMMGLKEWWAILNTNIMGYAATYEAFNPITDKYCE